MYDACANGQQLKYLTVIYEYMREALAIELLAIELLAKRVSVSGAPRYLRSDNCLGFRIISLLSWVVEQLTETAFIDPGKP